MKNSHVKSIPIYRIIKSSDKTEGIITPVIFVTKLKDEYKKLLMVDVCEMSVIDVFYDWEDFTSQYKLDVALRIYESIR